jgi:hypothetical protein
MLTVYPERLPHKPVPNVWVFSPVIGTTVTLSGPDPCPFIYALCGAPFISRMPLAEKVFLGHYLGRVPFKSPPSSLGTGVVWCTKQIPPKLHWVQCCLYQFLPRPTGSAVYPFSYGCPLLYVTIHLYKYLPHPLCTSPSFAQPAQSLSGIPNFGWPFSVRLPQHRH